MKENIDFTLYVLCLDEVTYELLNKMQLENIILIKLVEIEAAYPELLDIKKTRSTIEYYFTCSPVLPLYIFDKFNQVDRISYVDADLYFFSGVDKLFKEISDSSIAVVEHRFHSMKKKNLRYGRFNVGIVSFRRDEQGIKCLEKWKGQCIDWCYDSLEEDRFADQKYLDEWPKLFDNLVIIQNKGVNLAPWNAGGSKLSLNGANLMVNNNDLIFYHFHGLKRFGDRRWDSGLGYYLVRCAGVIRESIYKPYINQLLQIESELAQKYRLEVPRNKMRPPLNNGLFSKLSYYLQFLIRIILWNYIKI